MTRPTLARGGFSGPRRRGPGWLLPSWLAAAAALCLVTLSCTTSSRPRTELLDRAFDGAETDLRGRSGATGQDPAEALLAASGLPDSLLDNLRAEVARSRQAFAGGGASGRGVRQFFAPPRVAGAGARAVCDAELCAGAAARSLAPGDLDLPPRPGFPLRLLTGLNHPPLAGFGDRLADSVPAITTRLVFRNQFYSHLFKGNAGTLDPAVTNNVKALVLLDARGHKLVWVKTDLIGAFQDLRAEVLAELSNLGHDDIHDGNFLFHATHTHGGVGAINPRLLFQLATVDLFSEPVFDAVVRQVVEAVLAANAGLEGALLATGSTRLTGITLNRRQTCEEAGDPPNPEPDPQVGVLRVDSVRGEALATVFNFAIHGTSFDGTNLKATPDNMGYAEHFVEEQVGGLALFFNAAEGDVGPVSGSARTVGETLGQAVVETRAGLDPGPDVRLDYAFCRLDDPEVAPSYPDPCPHNLDPFALRPRKFVESSPGCFEDRDAQGPVLTIAKADDPPLLEREGVVLGVFVIETAPEADGDGAVRTTIVTVPGEPITEIGLRVKAMATREMGFDDAWVFSLTNAHLSYIVTEEEYIQGGYEAGSNLFGPRAGEVLTDNARHLLNRLDR